MSASNYVWIIEMLIEDDWQPTTGCNLTLSDARQDRENWKSDNPNDVFRIKKYIPEENYK